MVEQLVAAQALEMAVPVVVEPEMLDMEEQEALVELMVQEVPVVLADQAQDRRIS
jgi:hypothetical protein